MPPLPYRRAVAAAVLACLLLWNAPAMAFPALLEQVAECAGAPPAVPAAHAHHHHGMAHDALPVLPASPLVSTALCVTAHSCCTFNREPARINSLFAVDGMRAIAERVVFSLSNAAGFSPTEPAAFFFTRSPFQLKAELRI